MGGKSSQTQTTNSTTNPWAPAIPALQGLLGELQTKVGSTGLTSAENSAINAMAGSASAGNPYASGVGNVASTLLAGGGPDRTGMVNDAYSQYQSALTPFARGDYVDPSKNAGLQSYLSTIGNDVTSRINAMYAGAGRDPSGAGAYGQTLGRGIAEGTAPVLYGAYNDARNQQLGAINSLYGAGGTTASTLSGLDQTRLGNMQAGIGAAGAANEASTWGPQAMLAAEAARRGIPMQHLGQLTGLLGGIASLGQQSNATSETVKRASPMEQALGWTQAVGNLFGRRQTNQPYAWGS